jgi:hypothetical protein
LANKRLCHRPGESYPIWQKVLSSNLSESYSSPSDRLCPASSHYYKILRPGLHIIKSALGGPPNPVPHHFHCEFCNGTQYKGNKEGDLDSEKALSQLKENPDLLVALLALYANKASRSSGWFKGGLVACGREEGSCTLERKRFTRTKNTRTSELMLTDRDFESVDATRYSCRLFGTISELDGKIEVLLETTFNFTSLCEPEL